MQNSVQLDNNLSFDPWFDVEILWAIFLFLHCNFWDIYDIIMWVTLCYWMNLEVFIYHAISFLFSHHYLFLTERVGNMIFARSVAIWHSRSLMSDIFLAATKQLYKWYFPSVCLSVCPSVKNYLRTQITLYEEDKNYPIWRRQERRSKYAVQLASWQLRSNSPKMSVRLSHLFDYVPLILSSWNFRELLLMTKVRSMQKVKVRGQRSRSQRSQPNLTVSGL